MLRSYLGIAHDLSLLPSTKQDLPSLVTDAFEHLAQRRSAVVRDLDSPPFVIFHSNYCSQRSCRYEGAVLSAQNPGGTMPDEMPAHMSAPDVTVADGEGDRRCTGAVGAHGPITRQNLSSANKRVRPVGIDE